MTPEVQGLLDSIVRLTTKGAARPCRAWTPDADLNELYRVTVCAICHFPEAYHLLLLASDALTGADDGAWSQDRASQIEGVAETARRYVAEKAPPELVGAAIDALRGYALEPRPAAANETEAAAVVRAIVVSALEAKVEDKGLVSALESAEAWLQKHDRETSVDAAVAERI